MTSKFPITSSSVLRAELKTARWSSVNDTSARKAVNGSEGALRGSIQAHGLLTDTVIVSDDAGQFDLGNRHALCRVHAERLVHKLDTFTPDQLWAQQHVRSLIWWFHADLKAY